MGTEIKAAAIAAALGAFAGGAPGVRSPMPRSGSRERQWASSRQQRRASPPCWAARRSSARLEAAARSAAG